MSDVTLFDLPADEWVLVWEKSIQDFGWQWGDKSIPLHEDGSKVSKAEWDAFLSSGRCRDCGVSCAMNMGGAHGGGAFRVCEGCAQLDGCKLGSHTTVVERRKAGSSFPAMEEATHCTDCGWWLFTRYWGDEGAWKDFTAEEVIDACADHETARWRSRWGKQHEQGEHDGLVRAQRERRAKYLAQLAVTA